MPAVAGPDLAAHESLLDFGARFYDPATAIFLQQDPLAEKYYNISPYAYCANNPVNFVDPDGNTFVVGVRTRKVTFYSNKRNLITVSWKSFVKMGNQK